MRVRPNEVSNLVRRVSALGVAAIALLSSAHAQQPAPPARDVPAIPGQSSGTVAGTETADKPATEVESPAWPGTFADGFAQIRTFAEKQQLESAARVADALLAPNSFLRGKQAWSERGGWRAHVVAAVDPLLDMAGWNGLEPDVRAEVWYAKGVIATLAKDRETAEADLWKARGMTSDASLQRDTIYDLGTLSLQAGEEERAKLPEVSGKQAAPPTPVPSAPGAQPAGPGGAQPPDPLQLARAAYLLARDRFVERLRDDWQDADTQANVELCLKRLRELDDIEKKRKEEEQKKKDEQQKKDQQNKDQDKKDKDKDKQDPEKDQQGKDDPKKDQDKPKDEDKKKDEKKPDQPQDEKDKEAEKKKKDAQPTQKQDEQMSPEEMTQLLDRLQRIEDEHKKIEAQLRAMRRAKVKKDW